MAMSAGMGLADRSHLNELTARLAGALSRTGAGTFPIPQFSFSSLFLT